MPLSQQLYWIGSWLSDISVLKDIDMRYTEHIQPFESSKTDAEIALFCSTLCNKPLNCASVRTFCAATGAVTINLTTRQYSGPLVDFLLNPGLPDPLKKLALWFFQHVWMDQAETISLDGKPSVVGISGFDVVYGFGVLTQTTVNTNPAFSTLREGLVQLAGGLVYPSGVTITDISNARSSYLAAQELAATKQTLLNEGAARWNTFVTSLEAWNGSGSPPTL